MLYVKKNTPSQKRIPADAWPAFQVLLKVNERSVMIIHDVLVIGRQQLEVAHEVGLSAAAISRIVKLAWEAYVRCGATPVDWVAVSVALPKNDAEIVYEMVRLARARLVKGKQAK